MKRVLILGGGFGGVAAANRLRQLLPSENEITLVDRRSTWMVGFRKTWALVGQESLENGQGQLSALEAKGIRVIQGEITEIDPGERSVVVAGERLAADALIVALGAQLAPERIPGFQDHAQNVYDVDAIPAAARSLDAFPGGRVLIGIFGEPYKCPPAPFEIAIQVQDFFQERGVDAKVAVFTPKPSSLPILGEAGCEIIEGRLAERGITFLANHKALAVDPGQVRFTTQRPQPFDLLLGIPPHRVPEVVAASGLTQGKDWVPTNPRTLETGYQGVYAIGDMTAVMMANGKPLPKAGIFAEGQGVVAAERIAATFSGREPDSRFSGDGGCFLEVGEGKAAMVRGSFLSEPAPQVELTPAAAELLEEKLRFETTRLREWF